MAQAAATWLQVLSGTPVPALLLGSEEKPSGPGVPVAGWGGSISAGGRAGEGAQRTPSQVSPGRARVPGGAPGVCLRAAGTLRGPRAERPREGVRPGSGSPAAASPADRPTDRPTCLAESPKAAAAASPAAAAPAPASARATRSGSIVAGPPALARENVTADKPAAILRLRLPPSAHRATLRRGERRKKPAHSPSRPPSAPPRHGVGGDSAVERAGLAGRGVARRVAPVPRVARPHTLAGRGGASGLPDFRPRLRPSAEPPRVTSYCPHLEPASASGRRLPGSGLRRVRPARDLPGFDPCQPNTAGCGPKTQ